MEGVIHSESNIQDGLKHPPQVAVVMVPFPAQGHLNQLLHFSHLIASYGLPVHYAGSSTHNRQAKLRLQGWHSMEGGPGNKIQFHDFELPPYDLPPPNPDPSMHFPAHLQPLWDACLQLHQPVSQFLHELASMFTRVVVIYDSLMASVVQDVKFIQNTECYNFVPCCAFTIFLSVCDSVNHKLPFELEPDDVPRCEIPSDEGCWTPEIQNFIAQLEKYSGLECGNLYNTTREIESRYVRLLEKVYVDKKVFAIGPFNPVEILKKGNERHECLHWLDKQKQSSVIYVSFGTMTSITDEQITELAIGLERSAQKFIWVLREADKGNVFMETDSEVSRRPQLPEGYEERVKNRGIVIREWAPQLEILAHSSIGGFMSHCGWNSCLESISMGVPMATWPMHSDQPRNAILITEVLKIGTMVRDWTLHGELVASSVIEYVVRRLMASV